MKYMMADEGIHVSLGRHDSIGHESFDYATELCCVNTPAVDGYYVGSWFEGLGLINVLFPENQIRDLTPEERKFFSGRKYRLSGNPSFSLDISDDEDNLPVNELKFIVADVLSRVKITREGNHNVQDKGNMR